MRQSPSIPDGARHPPNCINALPPTQVRPHSGRTVAWRCHAGHTWRTRICRRTDFDHGCPYCAGRRLLTGANDLATVWPELAAEWDDSNELGPQEVAAFSVYRATWRCTEGHVWQSAVRSRTNPRSAGCLYCRGRRAFPGEIDLGSLRPDLAAEWDDSNTRSPDQFKVTSRYKVAWRCPKGHIWNAMIVSRANGRRCPQCAEPHSD